ncbi:MAG TPA: hypothetical protein VNT76_14935 [Candidatus Binatus sp.]|nr:hypothetical protein [Candidatus Binatus sp.]
MAVQSDVHHPPLVSSTAEISETYSQGVVAGLIGATTIALWFFIIDLFNGRPFYTPNVLGVALFHRGAALDASMNQAISFETVLFYTWIHGMVFCLIGGLAAKLLDLAERNFHLGFGVVLFLVIFEFGFVAAAFVFAESILHLLAWPLVLVGNLLAAIAMTIYFWRHHASLAISP